MSESKYQIHKIDDIIINNRMSAKILNIYRKKENHNRLYYSLQCLKCKYVFERKVYDAECGKNGSGDDIGCPCCSNKVVVKGINDITTTAPWMVKFFQGGEEEASKYTKGSAKKIYPICPFCNRISPKKISIANIYLMYGFECVCSDNVSIPNKIIRSIMEQALDLKMILSFEPEHNEYDENNTMRRFDIMFSDLNNNLYFIEMDGGFHAEIQKKHCPGKLISKELFIPDIMKDKIAQKLNIPLIRIDCYRSKIDYIKENIYNSELANIIDLSKIDWMKIDEFCSDNMMKKICQYKVDHPELFTTDVAEIFKVSSNIVREYWKRGTEYGWCNYNVLEEIARRNRTVEINHHGLTIYVEDLDTGDNWQFKSLPEFTEASKSIFYGENFSRKQWYSRFKNNNNNYLLYDTDDCNHSFIIWKSNIIGDKKELS